MTCLRTAIALACAHQVLAGARADDWILDPTPYTAEIRVDAASGRITLENGLVRRVLTTTPAAATVSLKNLTTGEEFVRSPGAEAWVVVDGERFEVGGLSDAPIDNYFLNDWVAAMKPIPGSYVYAGCRVEEPEKRLDWKKRPEWLAEDLPWPPKGKRLVMSYRPPTERAGDGEFGEKLLEERFLSPLGEDWREVLWCTTNRTSCSNEGKPGEIYSQCGTFAYLEHAWPKGATMVSARVSTNVDKDTYCWGPALAVTFAGKDKRGLPHRVCVFPRASAHEYEAGDETQSKFFGSFDPDREVLLELIRRDGSWWARATQKGDQPCVFRLSGDYGEPVSFRVGRLGFNRKGVLLPPGVDRVNCPNPPGEWTECRIHEVTCRAPADSAVKVAESLDLPTVEVAYEIYDGIPLVSKGIRIVNTTERTVRVDRLVCERLKIVEPTDSGQERGFPPRNIFVESDYMVHCMGPMHSDRNRIIRYQSDPNYATCTDFSRRTPAVLEVGPAVGPAWDIAPGETFDGLRAYELLFDSGDRVRRMLSLNRLYATVAPWTRENITLFHDTDATPEGLLSGVRQCAAAGFDVCTASFRSGADLDGMTAEFLAEAKKVSDEGRRLGVVLGAYALTDCKSVRRKGDEILNPPKDSAYPQPLYGMSPCLAAKEGHDFCAKVRAAIEAGGFGFFENDGPYSGDVCCATNHPYHRGADDSVWAQWIAQRELYRYCRANGVYINQPAWLFLEGGSSTGIGYLEQHWSLPREQQVVIERINIHDGIWNRPISMSWGFVPLTVYHGGGAAAVLEPLTENLSVYDQRMANLTLAGMKGCIRGKRLYDSPETLAMLRKWTEFRRRYRRVLDGDHIPLRRPDGRDWDGWLKVNPRAPGVKAIAALFNPTDEPMTRTISFPLYYAGLADETRTVTIPANGYAIECF